MLHTLGLPTDNLPDQADDPEWCNELRPVCTTSAFTRQHCKTICESTEGNYCLNKGFLNDRIYLEIQFLNINIECILITIEWNSKRGGEQSQSCKEVLDILHNNDTAVAKAISFLEIVAKEKTRSNNKKDNDNISARAVELVKKGINLFLLSSDPLYINIKIISKYS